ncbi:ISLre2 family transposase [Streptococcus suis]|uniref:ISLre2 family transposase n=1 Tax=Streptococcus suis TaxID=1307 RepID=UPI000CF3CC74
MSVILEKDLVKDYRQETIGRFLKFVEQFERDLVPKMKARGYKRSSNSERTVLFTFGEVTFSRSRWYKDGVCRIPLDEKLGLQKHVRHSGELIYQVAQLSTYMSYRQVVEVVKMVYGLDITKDTVDKAVKLSGVLLDQQEKYRFFEEEKKEKASPDVLYIEGDGLLVKSCEEGDERRNKELAHFIIHEGSQEELKNRFALQGKKEFVSTNHSKAKDQLLDYLFNHYQLSSHTILVTNSDEGKGYQYSTFQEMAKAFHVVRHEHFWDSYHLNLKIKEVTRDFPQQVRDQFFKAIQTNSTEKLEIAFDTLESLIEDEQQLEQFKDFKRKLSRNFDFTIPAKLRGLQSTGIGIMESQHRKITYRMKKRGMYWSTRGLDTMANLILLRHEGNLRDLFFGDWRKQYAYYSELEQHSVNEYLDKTQKDPGHQIPTGHLTKPIAFFEN